MNEIVSAIETLQQSPLPPAPSSPPATDYVRRAPYSTLGSIGRVVLVDKATRSPYMGEGACGAYIITTPARPAWPSTISDCCGGMVPGCTTWQCKVEHFSASEIMSGLEHGGVAFLVEEVGVDKEGNIEGKSMVITCSPGGTQCYAPQLGLHGGYLTRGLAQFVRDINFAAGAAPFSREYIARDVNELLIPPIPGGYVGEGTGNGEGGECGSGGNPGEIGFCACGRPIVSTYRGQKGVFSVFRNISVKGGMDLYLYDQGKYTQDIVLYNAPLICGYVDCGNGTDPCKPTCAPLSRREWGEGWQPLVSLGEEPEEGDCAGSGGSGAKAGDDACAGDSCKPRKPWLKLEKYQHADAPWVMYLRMRGELTGGVPVKFAPGTRIFQLPLTECGVIINSIKGLQYLCSIDRGGPGGCDLSFKTASWWYAAILYKGDECGTYYITHQRKKLKPVEGGWEIYDENCEIS